jgi:hypothetical protein
LTPHQEQQVFRWINGHDPRQYDLDFGLWAWSVVVELIERKFAIRRGVAAVGELLAKLGLTPQKEVLNKAHYPSDVISIMVLWGLRYKPSPRAPAEMFLTRGSFSPNEAVREWEAKLTPALAEHLRRRRKGRVSRSWYTDGTQVAELGATTADPQSSPTLKAIWPKRSIRSRQAGASALACRQSCARAG